MGGSDVVVGGAVNGVSAPDAAIGVVVYHEELLGDEGGGALAVDLDGLLHHVALDSGERIVAAGGAVGAVVAEVAFAALDLAGVPKLVLLAVVDVGVGGAGDHVGGDEGASEAGVAVGLGEDVVL